MRFKSIYILIILFSFNAISSFPSSQGVPYDIHKKPLWKNKKDIIIQELTTIGSDDFDKQDYMFGRVNDLAIDSSDNIYVLDAINYRATKFTSEGTFVRTFGNGNGQGPGEFARPLDICVDLNDYVYIADYEQRKITVFNSSNTVIHTFKTENYTIPIYDLEISEDLFLYVGVDTRQLGSGSWKHGIFQIYSLPEGKYFGSLGRPDWFKQNSNILTASNSISINKVNGNIVVSHSCPYEIELFSKKGDLIKRFGRKTSFFDKFLMEESNNNIGVSGGASFFVAWLPDGKIMNVIRHFERFKNKPSKSTRYFDFFDDKGNYLITVNQEDFGIHESYNLAIAVDNQGCIWLSFYEPYPHIKKFRIEFRDK